MDLQLKGKVALLAGGAGTIGRAVAHTLAGEGATCIVGDPADEAAPFETVSLDVTDPQSVGDAVGHVLKTHGRIDILVVLAGVYQGGPVTDISPEDWDRLMAINLKGTFLVCREVLPHMQAAGAGRIVCIASLAGQVGGIVAGANYSASKAGVLSLVKSLAKQSREPGITINAVSPGPVEGTMTGSWPTEQRDAVREAIPLKRFARPEEIADLVTFLSSSRASYIHGARIDVNGGVYMD